MKAKSVFENVPVPKSVLANAIPSITSMLVTLVYNVADTFFIGQTGDEMQVAAVSLTTPIFLLFMAFGILYGIGVHLSYPVHWGMAKNTSLVQQVLFAFGHQVRPGLFVHFV